MTRYGIAEWYGRNFLALTPFDRQNLANIALGMENPPQCPFRKILCNKKGGVCSIRPYSESGGRIDAPVDDPVIVCPVRFEQNHTVVRWLGEIVGFEDEHVLMAREIPFMLGTTTSKPAGKIDLVVAQECHGLKWFGLEIQAVYFSGPGMEIIFLAQVWRVNFTP